MYRRLSSVMFPIVVLLLLGVAVWGYKENQDKNSVLIKAENQYQRAFHDLTFHMDTLHKEIGNTIAVNSTSQGYQRKGLVNVWRLTSQAQSEINQLPLMLLPFNKTKEFLANIANFSYRTSIRDLTAQPMSKDELKTLKTLYDHSMQISGDLRKVQTKVLDHNLRWMDVELALATEKKSMDNSIIDGLKTVDGKVNAYEEVNWGPSVPVNKDNASFSKMSGTPISANQIKQKAAQFLGIDDSTKLKVRKNGKGTKESDTYSVSLKGNNTASVQMDYTKKGGKLIWFMNSRDVLGKKISRASAIAAGSDFLKKHGYGNKMKVINDDEYANVASITYATVQDSLIIYPEKITVRVALDQGEVVGLLASDYLHEHNKRRDLKVPTLSINQAKAKLNPDFKITNHELALIKNEIEQEVICHEFSGKINGTYYKIFLNGATGVEEKIENMEAQ